MFTYIPRIAKDLWVQTCTQSLDTLLYAHRHGTPERNSCILKFLGLPVSALLRSRQSSPRRQEDDTSPSKLSTRDANANQAPQRRSQRCPYTCSSTNETSICKQSNLACSSRRTRSMFSVSSVDVDSVEDSSLPPLVVSAIV